MRLDRPLATLAVCQAAATPAIILIYISTLSKLNPHVSTRNWMAGEGERGEWEASAGYKCVFLPKRAAKVRNKTLERVT